MPGAAGPWLIAIALLVLVLGCAHPRRPDQLDRGCADRVRSRLPDWADPELVSATIESRPVGAKHLLLDRGDVVLVIDYAVLRAQMVAFMEAQGAWRYPREEELLDELERRLEQTSELMLDETTSPEAWGILERPATDVLEAGGFAIRPSDHAARILRIEWSYSCGPECGARGRTFVTETCDELLNVTDMRS